MPGTGYIAPFRNTIYAVISRVGPTSSQGVVALDAKTGVERWYQPASERFAPAVTSAGVVVGIPDSFPTEGSIWDFHVALLGLETGEPIWRSAETYQLPGGIRPSSAQIASGAVVFVDRQMTLAAIDLASGQERWRVESSEPPAPDCEGPNFQAPCSAAGPAILGDMVYFDNPVTGKIVAVSLRTGEQQWAVDDPFDRSETNLLYVDIVNLAAVDQGVVVSTGVSPNPEGWFGLLSATDGSTIWQWNSDKEVLGYVRAGDALIVLARDRGDSTWRLERVDLATGTVLLTSSELDLGDEFGFIRSLPDANLVILTSWTADSVGFNPESLAVTWTQPAIEGCKPFLPLLPDGKLACATKDGLAVYELVSELATPSASAGATIPAQIENGDFLITLTPGIITREEPAPDADIAAVYAEAGATLQYVGRSRIDSDGNLWYRVRNIETARVDWIPATDVVSDK
jgi:outer membrane protein assembly factor BamB